MTVKRFLSDVDDVIVHESGWFSISDDLEMTKVPLIDRSNFLFFRAGTKPTLDKIAEFGWRLPTIAEYDILHKEGLFIEPYILPTLEMKERDGIVSGSLAERSYRENNMMSIEWCEIHDHEVWSRIEAAGWDRNHPKPVVNAGKYWCEPDASTAPGMGLIYGWFTPHARKYGVDNDFIIQTPYRHHDFLYDDYATTCHAVRKKEKPTC